MRKGLGKAEAKVQPKGLFEAHYVARGRDWTHSRELKAKGLACRLPRKLPTDPSETEGQSTCAPLPPHPPKPEDPRLCCPWASVGAHECLFVLWGEAGPLAMVRSLCDSLDFWESPYVCPSKGSCGSGCLCICPCQGICFLRVV